MDFPDSSEALTHKIRALPEPRSYFRGAATASLELPQNLLVFQRSRPSMLGKEHHYHYRFVLIANLRRTGVLALDHRSIEIRGGEALLIFPHQFHHWHEPEAEDIRWLFITFELNQTESLAPMRNPVRRISPLCYTYLSHLIDAYVKRSGGSRTVSPSLGLLAALVLQELTQEEGRVFAAAAPAQPSVVDKVCRYVWDHFGKELGLDVLAKEFCYSESHLRLLFRQRMGMSLGAYIQKVRMNRARAFLVGTDKNVSEVAQECGYDSLYSFSRTFKKSTGVSPLAYRKLNAGKY
jgi:AraC-like DNA-binding protein